MLYIQLHARRTRGRCDDYVVLWSCEIARENSLSTIVNGYRVSLSSFIHAFIDKLPALQQSALPTLFL